MSVWGDIRKRAEGQQCRQEDDIFNNLADDPRGQMLRDIANQMIKHNNLATAVNELNQKIEVIYLGNQIGMPRPDYYFKPGIHLNSERIQMYNLETYKNYIKDPNVDIKFNFKELLRRLYTENTDLERKIQDLKETLFRLTSI